jgi:hypothetical protein
MTLTQSSKKQFDWWLGLAPATLEFWVRFPNRDERNQGKQAHPVLKYRIPHGSQSRPGWAPDLPMVTGITLSIGDLIPGTREEPGTLIQGAPVFPGSSHLGIEPKTPGWLVQDPTTRPIGDLIPTIGGSQAGAAHPGVYKGQDQLLQTVCVFPESDFVTL